MTRNETLVFNSIPQGYPVPGETLKKVVEEIDLDQKLETGSVLLKTVALSLDPYMRGRMRAPGKKSYVPEFTLHQPLQNSGVAKVVRSANDQFKEGDYVYTGLQFKEYQVLPEQYLAKAKVLDQKLGIPWAVWTGAAGMPGQTAFNALNKIGQPKKGETIFISGASGAVGQVVAALAQHAGLKVIGSAGSDDKVEFLKKDLKFDVAWNYKTENTKEILQKNPFDIYWDNVGGETLEAVLDTINEHGRIIACGQISAYNGESYPLRNTFNVVTKRLLFQGFINGDFDQTDFYNTVPKLISEGKVITKEHIVKGLDNGEAFLDLMKGGNFGKSVIVFDE
ncbi:zinc-binding alcohol dehydrogenase domain-containing protein [Pseudohyphozyma bogoriensis]|nr:zinc-binding alcohol dehydrogenase domain-containing protein [Pseudohyphozyma bogoriensis]